MRRRLARHAWHVSGGLHLRHDDRDGRSCTGIFASLGVKDQSGRTACPQQQSEVFTGQSYARNVRRRVSASSTGFARLYGSPESAGFYKVCGVPARRVSFNKRNRLKNFDARRWRRHDACQTACSSSQSRWRSRRLPPGAQGASATPAPAGSDAIRNFCGNATVLHGASPGFSIREAESDGVKAVLNLRTPGEHRAEEEQAAVETEVEISIRWSITARPTRR